MLERAGRIWMASGLLGVGLCVAASASGGGTSPPARERDEPAAEATYARTPAALVPFGKSVEPYRRFYETAPVNRGSAGDVTPPEDVGSIRIGLLAPLEGSTDRRAGSSLRRGAELALDEANASGGYHGFPFELVIKNDQALWGSSANTLIELAYVDRVWAMIGSIDSNSTHVALRAALKAELPIVNVGSTDPTMTETGIPWIVRITPDDRQTGYRLASLVFGERGFDRVAVIRASDRYGRLGVREFRDAARRLGKPVPMELLIRPGQEELTSPLDRLATAEVQAVVLWVKAEDAGRLVRELRRRGLTLPVIGTDRLVASEFLDLAGTAAEGVQATAWINLQRRDERWLEFQSRFRDRHGVDPDAFAAYAYDAAQLVVEAVRRNGLNRARIRDGLTAVREHEGVTGVMRFDATSNNVAPVFLTRVEEGRFVFD